MEQFSLVTTIGKSPISGSHLKQRQTGSSRHLRPGENRLIEPRSCYKGNRFLIPNSFTTTNQIFGLLAALYLNYLQAEKRFLTTTRSSTMSICGKIRKNL